MKKYNKVLTIAGSDSGGGAGIQADLKTFMACGCYGMSVITAITAQNTIGVTAIHPVPVDIIKKQLEAVFEDIEVDAIKIGMLHSVEVIKVIADTIKAFPSCPLVLDPVMVATSGDRLIQDDAIGAMKDYLFPLATLITPNIPEADVLLNGEIAGQQGARDAAIELSNTFQVGALVKGGHLTDSIIEDVFCSGKNTEVKTFTNNRLETKNSHGTGCTLSSAIAAYLTQGRDVIDAIDEAEKYLHGAILVGADYTTGHGNGPVCHHHRLLIS